MSRGRGAKDKAKTPGDFGWGDYMESKRAKLEAQGNGKPALSAIFQDVSIYVDGWTDPSTSELKELVRAHGGHFSLYRSRRTTHTIASVLPKSKLEKLRPGDKVVQPKWLTDSIAAGRRVPEFPYLVGREFHSYGGLEKYVATDACQDAPSTSKETEDPIPADIPSTSKEPERPTTSRAGGMLKTTDPGFIADFYARSRLHHISTWAIERKDWVRKERRKRPDGPFPRADALAAEYSGDVNLLEEDVVAHVDMDCFFVSALLAKRPELAGKPVGVTHSSKGEGKGTESWAEVASASYEARAKGVKNGMLLGKARQLCPDLQTVAYDFPAYQAASQALYSTVSEFSLSVEAVSCDELYVDLGELCLRTGADPPTAVRALRAAVSKATGCPVSAGLGPNKLAARMATRKAKPDGQFWLRREAAESYMAAVPLRDLPGVGRQSMKRLEELGLSLCGDLGPRASELPALLGAKTAQQLIDYARGIDDRKMGEENERKSVSCEINYGIRLESVGISLDVVVHEATLIQNEETKTFLGNLSAEVAARMAAAEVVGTQLTLKVMIRAAGASVDAAKYMGHGICDSVSRSRRLPRPSGDAQVLATAALQLLSLIKHDSADLRGIGMTVTKLEQVSAAPPGPRKTPNPMADFFKPRTPSPRKRRPDSAAAPPSPFVKLGNAVVLPKAKPLPKTKSFTRPPPSDAAWISSSRCTLTLGLSCDL